MTIDMQESVFCLSECLTKLIFFVNRLQTPVHFRYFYKNQNCHLSIVQELLKADNTCLIISWIIGCVLSSRGDNTHLQRYFYPSAVLKSCRVIGYLTKFEISKLSRIYIVQELLKRATRALVICWIIGWMVSSRGDNTHLQFTLLRC